VPRRQLTALRVISFLAFFAAWEITTRLRIFTPFLLPSPMVVLDYLKFEVASGELWINLQLTLGRMFTGFAIATVIGVPLGIGIARMPLVRWFFDPLLSIALPMPIVAFLPIFILWLGVYDASKIALIATSAVFPIIVQSWAGAENIDKFMSWSALSLGVSRRAFLWDIALPAALPQIVTGLQVALPTALIAATVTEMLMGGAGMGGAIIHGMRMSDSPELFGGIVAVGILGYVLGKAMELLRSRLLVWHQETQTG
jgi:taurine transport system permease protein